MPIRNSSYSNSLFSNSGTNGNSVFNSRRRGFNRRVVVQTPSLNYQLRRFEIVVNSRYDNVITKAIKLYIEPLGTGEYNLIPTSTSTILKIINTLQILSKIPEYEIIIKYILNAVMAASNVRAMYDNKSISEQEILRLKKDLENLRLGLNTETSFSSSGLVSSKIKITLNPLISEYIRIYGMPKYGEGMDSFRLQEIQDELISKGINPYSL